MRRYLPLADSILRMVVRNMPNPVEAQKRRLSTLLPPQMLTSPNEKIQRIVERISGCSSSENDEVVVFISKMIPVRIADLSKSDIQLLNLQQRKKLLNALATSNATEEELRQASEFSYQPDEEVFMAVGRVFCGTLRRTSELFVLGHKHHPTDTTTNNNNTNTTTTTTATLTRCIPAVNEETHERLGCYLMLGPSVIPTEYIRAGNILGIIGLEEYILKTATLSTTPVISPLKAITFQAKPMLKVAVEPRTHTELKRLEQALQSLYQFDPVVEVELEESGQWTMTCLGELHLDQCVKALSEKFMK